jgi:Transmembrane domain of unknown function (DUF3566)
MTSVSRQGPFGAGPAPAPVIDAPPGRPAVPGRRPAVARTPVPSVPPRARRRRVVQGRRSRRVIRRIDAWTVLKLSFLFYLSVALVLMIAGIILWNIASTFNVIHNVEKFIRSLLDLQTFTFQARVIFEAGAALCGLVVVLGTGVNVLSAILYNLMSDVVGGVQIIVLEEAEEPVGPPVAGPPGSGW